MTRGLVVLMVSCVLLAGCEGDEPITPAAIAAITQEHVDLEPREISQWDVFTVELGEKSPGVYVQYGDVSLAVVVAPSTDSPHVCADQSFFDECVPESYGDEEVIIAWQGVEPEEDPGVVYVIDRREDEDVVARLTGPAITADPRTLDLGMAIEDLASLVTDPRLSLTTSQEVVDLGGDEVSPPGPHVTGSS